MLPYSYYHEPSSVEVSVSAFCLTVLHHTGSVNLHQISYEDKQQVQEEVFLTITPMQVDKNRPKEQQAAD
uniref:Uncharacterized protein n=1 Tax=Arundo donax TaxID=35708 RepID=A0A0A9DYW5_ARUDO